MCRIRGGGQAGEVREVGTAVEAIARRQLLLDEPGLVPEGRFERIVRHAVGLATENFYEKVKGGVIDVRRRAVIDRLHDKDGRPTVELSDGTLRAADAVVCATGFIQHVPFFNADLQRRLTDDDGNFELYRQIMPLDVPRLFFVGYGSSLFGSGPRRLGCETVEGGSASALRSGRRFVELCEGQRTAWWVAQDRRRLNSVAAVDVQ